MFPVEGPVCATARRWDQARHCGLGGGKGGCGWLEHGMSMGRCGMELKLDLIIALLPSR